MGTFSCGNGASTRTWFLTAMGDSNLQGLKDERPREGARSKRQERTEWHRVQAWGKLGAAAIKKGSHICVEGCAASKPSSGAYAAASMEATADKVRTYDIVANSIINLRAGQRKAQVPDSAEAAA